MERTEKRALIICSAAAIVLIFAVLIARIPNIKAANEAKQAYIGFEENAVNGVPQINDEGSNYNSLELPLKEEACVVSMDATPLLKENKLYIMPTADGNNTAYVRIVLYDNDGTEVGRSGLLKAGEYTEYIQVSDSVVPGDEIKAKILTYEPETYYSLGSANAALKVR